MVLKSLSLRLLFVPAVVVVLLALLAAAGPARAGTLDQQQTTATHGTHVFGPRGFAQTFTAQIGGQLDQVDVLLQRVGSPGDLTVQIRTVSGGVPSAVLASTTVPEASVPTSGGWVSVAISAPSVVGSQYAIALGAAGGTGCGPEETGCYDWRRNILNPYAAGHGYFSADSGATWALHDGDFTFKTYVTPPPPLPTTKEDCKNGGWQNYGTTFKNQGDCVSFVASGGKNPPTG